MDASLTGAVLLAGALDILAWIIGAAGQRTPVGRVGGNVLPLLGVALLIFTLWLADRLR